MSAKEFLVKVLSPNRPVANVKGQGVMLPGALGYMEILPEHAAMVSAMEVGELKIRKTDGSSLSYFVSGGFVEVRDQSVTVLADTIEAPTEIDRERAEQAAKRAEDRLIEKDPHIDLGRALESLRRASGRIAYLEKVAQHI